MFLCLCIINSKGYSEHLVRFLCTCALTGAQSVLVTQWQVPDIAMEKFYFSFYHSLKKEEHISGAVSAAVDALRNDDR